MSTYTQLEYAQMFEDAVGLLWQPGSNVPLSRCYTLNAALLTLGSEQWKELYRVSLAMLGSPGEVALLNHEAALGLTFLAEAFEQGLLTIKDFEV